MITDHRLTISIILLQMYRPSVCVCVCVCRVVISHTFSNQMPRKIIFLLGPSSLMRKGGSDKDYSVHALESADNCR